MRLDQTITQTVDRYLASEEFGKWFSGRVEAAIIDIIRAAPDAGINLTGFMLKMAVEIFDCSGGSMPFRSAKKHAHAIYLDFLRDNKRPKFGDPDFDWTGASARLLAHEYSIDYWEAR